MFNTFSIISNTIRRKPLRSYDLEQRKQGLSCLFKGSSVMISPTDSSWEWLPSNSKICCKAAKNLKVQPCHYLHFSKPRPYFFPVTPSIFFKHIPSPRVAYFMSLCYSECKVVCLFSAMNGPELGRAALQRGKLPCISAETLAAVQGNSFCSPCLEAYSFQKKLLFLSK